MDEIVDIVIPCYNSEKFIDKTLAAIFAQTHKNLNVICINDGSTDSTLQKLQTIANSEKRLTIIDKKNEGVEYALKDCIKLLKGNYIFPHGHDDTISHDAIELALKAFKENTDLDVVRVELVYVDGDDNVLRTLHDDRILDGYTAVLETLPQWKIHAFCLWKNKLFERINDLDSKGLMDFDELTTRYLFSLSNKVGFCDGKYFYLQHSEAVTKKFSLKRFDTMQTNFLLHEVFKKMKDVPKEILTRIEKLRFQDVWGLYVYFLANKKKLSIQEIKTVKQKFKHHYNIIDKQKQKQYWAWYKRPLLLSNFLIFSATAMLYRKLKNL